MSDIAIGRLMLRAEGAVQVPLVFCGSLVLAVRGIAMNAVMAMLEKCMRGSAKRSGLAAR